MYLGPDDRPDVGICSTDNIVLGDSTVAATDLCERLQASAGLSGYAGRFVDLGVTAANSGMSLARLVHDLVHLQPRSVTVVGGGSDILMPMSFDPRPGFPHIQLVYDLLFEQRFDTRERSIWPEHPERERNDLRHDFFERLSKLRRQVAYRSARWEAEIVASLVRNVAKMAAICCASGIPFLFVLQPTPLFKAVLSRAELAALPPPDSRDYIRRQFEAASRALTGLDVWMSPRTDFADLHDLFREDTSDIFRDVIHTRQIGVDRVADAIAGRLRPLLS
jgi:hypothetical protein